MKPVRSGIATVQFAPAPVFNILSGTGLKLVGFSLSLIVTVNEQVTELLEASVAFQVTVVTPLLNTVPLRVLPVDGDAPAPVTL